MSAHRILLVSIARPSRTARVARRIVREAEGATICGIVQCPTSKLPIAQRLLASGGNYGQYRGLRSKFIAWLSSCAKLAVHTALWLIHGCPRKIRSEERRVGKE